MSKLAKAWKSFNKKQARRNARQQQKREKSCKPKTVVTPQQKARRMLYNAIKAGDIVRQENCEFCCSGERVEAHHADYNKPLQVSWLCRSCHIDGHGWSYDPF